MSKKLNSVVTFDLIKRNLKMAYDELGNKWHLTDEELNASLKYVTELSKETIDLIEKM